MPSENKWLLLRSGSGNPDYNMALDEALLLAMPRLNRPVLRFYGWTEPAASFGYSQNYAQVSAMTPLRPLLRRTTGGGVVPHDADWTYSLTFPVNHEWHALKAVASYGRTHEWVSAGLGKIGIEASLAPTCRVTGPGQCFEGYEKSDVLWHGLKVAGAAQRRSRDGLLIQGSVQPRFGNHDRTRWEEGMIEIARQDFGIIWDVFELPPWVVMATKKLVREKYSRDAYNRKR